MQIIYVNIDHVNEYTTHQNRIYITSKSIFFHLGKLIDNVSNAKGYTVRRGFRPTNLDFCLYTEI